MKSKVRASAAGVLIAGLIIVIGAAAPVLAAGQGQGKGKGKPGVEFDENESPLQKGIKKSVEDRTQEEMLKPQCKNAMDSGDQSRIEKFCDVPKLNIHKLDHAECPTCGDMMNPNGKIVGKRIKTRTTLVFDRPGQRDPAMTHWDRVMVGKRAIGEIGNGTMADLGLGHGSDKSKLRRAELFPDTAVNDDRDCVDTVTGEHKGGYLDPSMPASPANLIPDGDPASCFDANHELKRTLVETTGGCIHDNGTFLMGSPTDGVDDACFDENGDLKTSLEELVDEDGPEQIDDDNDGQYGEDPVGDLDGDGNDNDDNDCISVSGHVFRDGDCFDAQGQILPGLAELVDEDGPDSVDQDDDGRVNEDAPNGNLDDNCRNFGANRGLKAGLGDVDPGGECDLTRAMIVSVNDQMMQQHGMKLYKADDDGNFDSNAGGMVEFGQERRKVVLTETFTLECEDGMILVDGQCVTDTPANARLSLRSGSAPVPTDPAGPGSRLTGRGAGLNGVTSEQVMMGFTVAPPVLKWGPKIEEYACVDLPLVGEVCVEVFYARVGYEFDMAVGLRLPMEVSVTEVPQPTALAGTEKTLQTTIQPLDFTARQYKDFCVRHKLDQEPFISDCDRFSFPTLLDELNPLIPADQKDGDEFVARLVAFAGVIVRVVGVPVINWGIDTAVDLPTLCTFLEIKDNNFNFLNFGVDLANDKGVLGALKNQLANCSSFTTPFGVETDPTNPLLKRIRAFPLAKSFDVRADCAEALVRGETVTIKKKTRPICTGLVLGANGASLGIGFGLEASAGSRLVQASWDAKEDARPGQGQNADPLSWEHSADEGEDPVGLGTVQFDNFDPTLQKDNGRISLEDFTYYLNTLQLKLRARLQFGGILSPIPDIASLTIFNFIFDTGTFGIPIGQHAGTENVEIPVFVENYGLEVDAQPATQDPLLRVNDSTLKIKPGTMGAFQVNVRNRGNVFGDFDGFHYELSNRPNQTPPYTFTINPNTDFDCVDSAGAHFRGNPYDGVGDDCYTGGGAVRSDRTELIDEDPPGPAGAPASVRDEDGDGLVDEDPVDVWAGTPGAADFAQETIQTVAPETLSPDSVSFAVSPFRHPLTRPGLYPVRVTADSRQARVNGMDAVDPSDIHRLGAEDIVFIVVTSFFEPQIEVAPPSSSLAPGGSRSFDLTGTNFGNADDSMTVDVRFVDSNQAGCSLATLGTIPATSTAGCPYRAFPTVIPTGQGGVNWTTVGNLTPEFGPLGPLDVQHDSFSIQVPADWAGMDDTVYQFIVTVTSTGDTASPAASNSTVVEQTVTASQQSMTRYAGLEIDELIGLIEQANAQGISTGGLLPIVMHPVKMTNDRALGAVLAGDPASASRILSTAIRIMGGFQHALDGRSLPASLLDEWTLRASAIVSDLNRAAGGAGTLSTTTTAPGTGLEEGVY